jgi:uncharacterized membrane protein YjfL (UPF0719 family)
VKPTLLVIAATVALLTVFSAIRVIREPALAAVLQLLGAILLVVMVLTHIAEALSLVPQMGWGRPNTPGHYLDLASAAAGIVLLMAGISLRRFATGKQ